MVKCLMSLLIAVSLAFSSSTVFMESGQEYVGRITSIGSKVVLLQTDSTHSRTIPIAKIMALKNDGNMVNGPFEYSDLRKYFPDAIDAAAVESVPAVPDSNTSQAHPDSSHISKPHVKKDIFGYRLAIQAKPLNFIFAQILGKDAPFPARFAVARLRLVSFLALEAEPSVIIGGVGGYSFLVGPAILQTQEGFASNPATISLKYQYIYFNRWGNENAFLIEVTHQIKMNHFLVGFGGGLGIGLNGVTATNDYFDYQGREKIVEVSNGVFASLVFDMGFCL
jgi:hypothetical protein